MHSASVMMRKSVNVIFCVNENDRTYIALNKRQLKNVVIEVKE